MRQTKTTKNTRRVQERKKKMRRSPVSAFFIMFFVTACLIGVYVLTDDNKSKTPPPDNLFDYQSTLTPSFSNNTAANNSETAQIGITTLTDSSGLTYDQFAQISSNQLFLINSDHNLPDDISENLVKVSDYVRTLNTDSMMNKDALIMLKAMLDSAANDGYNEFRITEGYRTFEYQQSLYESATDKSYVALSGYSEHQTGLAADISYNGVNIGNSKQGKWLMDNAYQYGFILRYPQDKKSITKLPYEPWHYRYIGLPHAYFCYENDLCFEEYIDYLKKNLEITITVNGSVYAVRYLTDSGETIEMPQNFSYEASLDNTGGLIVTSWSD